MIRYLLILFSLTSMAHAQDFEGICHLSCRGMQWSGVAISQTEILTVAHPEPTEDIWIAFPLRRHDAETRIAVKGRVVRANKLADLAIVHYNCPSTWVVKTYQLSRNPTTVADIRGYVVDDSVSVNGVQVLPDTYDSDGYTLIGLQTPARHGLSGSGIFSGSSFIGIQSCGGDVTYAVDAQTIQSFLEDK